jgi:hypothetical protein
MREYARQSQNTQLEADAFEVRKRAERRLGELIAEQKSTKEGLAKGGQPYQSTGSRKEPVDRTPTLRDAGISRKLSSKSQKLAAMPERAFQEALQHAANRYWSARQTPL